MKSLIKPAGLVFAFGLLIFFGAQLLFTQEVKQIRPIQPSKSQETIPQETYVSKVIISAPWGKKNLVNDGQESPPGEFGYYVPKGEGEFAGGPSCFAVAPNGDIYIVDGLNKRIQKFSPEGSLLSIIPFSRLGKDPRTIGVVDLCIDQNENIYLLNPGESADWEKVSEETMGRVLKCDQKGNLLKTYPVLTGVAMTANFVYCDKFGRIFYAYPWNGDKSGFYQVGTSERAFSLTEQKNSTRLGWLGFNSVPLDSNCFVQAARLPRWRFRAIFLVSFQADTLKTYRSYPPLEGEFFGCDEELNIYVGTYSGMRKYNVNGDSVGGWKFGCENPFLTAEGLGGSRTVTLDAKGNLYVLCFSQDDGIRVIKWYKQP